jgi:alpha-tubulin suppressor-like RCC1 family protein
VWAWGRNTCGQLGLGDTTDRTRPVLLPTTSAVMQFGAGFSHSVALHTDGTVSTWGSMDDRGFPNAESAGSLIPTMVQGLTDIHSIASASTHCLALNLSGQVLARGRNCSLVFEPADLEWSSQPILVKSLSGVIATATWGETNGAELEDGTIRIWGWIPAGLVNGQRQGRYTSEPCRVDHPRVLASKAQLTVRLWLPQYTDDQEVGIVGA